MVTSKKQKCGGKKMEFGNLMKVVYGAHVISGAYSKINQPNTAADDDKAVSVIQYLIHGKISEGQKMKSTSAKRYR